MRPLRIAWTGSGVGEPDTGSAAALGGMLLRQLLEHGIQVDLYYADSRAQLPASLREHPNLTVVDQRVRFGWDRWYSRNRVAALLSGLGTRSLAHAKLGCRLIRNHRRLPYDVIFQFSQMELLLVGRVARILPPIVVHPCTTASRELLWHRRESRYALKSESRRQHYMVRAYLHLRTGIQRNDLKRPWTVAGPSETYNRLMCEDYGFDPARTRVLRHPVDNRRFRDVKRRPIGGRPVVLLFASRVSTRKGFELIAGLSHRLASASEDVHIKVVGGASLWSDYRAHLNDLHPGVAHYVGQVSPTEMHAVYAGADALLVPSHYEPGSLVVGEALASGLPVVASDQVGPVEVLDRRVCRVFPDGDLKGFEHEVRNLVTELRAEERDTLAHIARHEAQEHFSPERIGRDLIAILDEAAAGHTSKTLSCNDHRQHQHVPL